MSNQARGPATEPSLGGYLPTVRAFVEEGYAVAFTDYEGLGRPGMHPYLEPRSAAFNVVDAVRALRELAPTVSTRWIAYGASQGGQATWAANELNPYYGDGLELLGSVAVSPAANVTGLADLAWEGSLTTEQERYYPLVIAGIERYNRDLRPGAYLHGRVAADMGALAKCASPVDGFLTRMEASSDLKPNTIQDTDRLRDALRKVALPQRRLDQPMMVTNGTDDEIILPQWVSSSVSLSCQMGRRASSISTSLMPATRTSLPTPTRRCRGGSPIDSPALRRPPTARPASSASHAWMSACLDWSPRSLRRLLPVAAAVLIACTAITTASPGPAAPPTEAGNAMYDDFDGPAGAPPSSSILGLRPRQSGSGQ